MRFAKRAAVFLFVSTIAAIAVTVSVEALRLRFFKFMQQVFPQYSTITYKQMDDYYTAPEDFIAYAPTYIPEGFVLERAAITQLGFATLSE